MHKKVIIAALDWGLGHATRMIPIVQYYIDKGWQPILASSGDAAILWQQRFPNKTVYNLPAYNFTYKHKTMVGNVLSQVPKIKKAIKAENAYIDKLVDEHKPELIISDNRYGVYHSRVKSVFITHQLQVLPPSALSFSSAILRKLHELFIGNFTEVWVPDFGEENNLSGKLSHGFESKLNIKYIGPLSRFKFANELSHKESHNKLPNIVALVSGPEPARGEFEAILRKQLGDYKGNYVLLLGKPGEVNAESDNKIYNHLQDSELEREFQAADLLISRSGYSTIMDLYNLRKKAVFIPTPGQTEQEYLADRFMGLGMFFTMPQGEFNLNIAIEEYNKYSGFEVIDNQPLASLHH